MNATIARQLKASLLIVTALLASCGSRQQQDRVGSAGRRLCHERQADAPPGTSVKDRREGFRECLQTIEDEIAAQNRRNQILQRLDTERRLAQRQQEAARIPSAQERFSHCRQVQEQVIAAERLRIRSVGPAMVSARTLGADSPEAGVAQANLTEAMIALEQLIPEPMRAGRDLLPDAVSIFSRCNPAEFSDP